MKNNERKVSINYIRIAVICTVVYCACTMIYQQFKINEYNIKEDYYISKIDEKKKALEKFDEIENKVESTEYMERLAREKLGLVRPYEKIFVDVNQ